MSLWPFSSSNQAEPTASPDPSTTPPVEGSGPPPPDDSNETPAPQYVTTDQFNQLAGTMNELAGYMKTVMTQPEPEPLDDQPEPVPQAPPRTVTIDQINAAYAEGDYGKGAQLMAKFNAEEVKSQLFEFEQTRFNPVVKHASRTMSSMSEQSAQTLPHYDRFKKEIAATVKAMGPNAGSSPENWKIAYRYVLGQHHEELLNEAVEARARQTAQEPGGSPAPKSGNPKASTELTVKDAYLGDYDGLRKMAQMSGLSAEQLVQKQYAKSSFKGSFQDYLKSQRQAREDQYV